MKVSKVSRRYRVLTKHFDFLQELDAETKEIHREALIQFNKAFQAWRIKHPQLWERLPPVNQQIPIPPPVNNNEEFINPHLKKEINDLFKEIAKKTHPDVSGDENEDFIEAKTALDENDFSKMLNVANALNIETPEPTFGMIQKLEKEVRVLEKSIDDVRETVIWVWHHERNPNVKNQLFTQFLQHLKQ